MLHLYRQAVIIHIDSQTITMVTDSRHHDETNESPRYKNWTHVGHPNLSFDRYAGRKKDNISKI